MLHLVDQRWFSLDLLLSGGGGPQANGEGNGRLLAFFPSKAGRQLPSNQGLRSSIIRGRGQPTYSIEAHRGPQGTTRQRRKRSGTLILPKLEVVI